MTYSTAQPITSDRAELVAPLLHDASPRLLLAEGRVTLRAVAVALYGGDMDAAKADLYPQKDATNDHPR